MLHDKLLAGRISLIFLTLLCSGVYAHVTNKTNCLELRDRCQNALVCRSHLRSLNSKCSNSLLGCPWTTSELCQRSLKRIRRTFGINDTCTCNVQEDEFDECIRFRMQIWQNPCETAFVEDIQRVSSNPPTPRSVRMARSLNSAQIQRWKKEFSQEVKPDPALLSSTSCTTALFELCLKHISCRELWKLFRQECAIDAQNVCHMTNKNDCWQSFEGISWTGLGNCSCTTNNSDCHWIRLQTNYNKCIYEITSSGHVPNAISVNAHLPSISTTPVVPYWVTVSSANPHQYSYQTTQQNQVSTSWWTTSSTTSRPASSLQREEYLRESERRESERREHEKRLQEYEAQQRKWETQRQRYNSKYHSKEQHTLPSTELISIATTSTLKPYVRAAYSSTLKLSASDNLTKTYRVNGAYYRKNGSQQTITAASTPTTILGPKTTGKPATTATTTTTSTTTATTVLSTTTKLKTTKRPNLNDSDTGSARLPIQYAKQKQQTTVVTTAATALLPEPVSTKDIEPDVMQNVTSLMRSTYSNVDEDKLRAFILKQRSRDVAVEELNDVLVSRWQLPTNKSDNAGSRRAENANNSKRSLVKEFQ